MKKDFPGYYRPTDDEFATLWKTCVFAIDANVLLNLYRYRESARNQLLKVFERISDRLWIPFQAALEFQRNRPIVIAEQKSRFREVRKIVEDARASLEGNLSHLQLSKRHSTINPDDLLKKISSDVGEFLKHLDSMETEFADVHEEDLLRQTIDALLVERIGPAPTNQLKIDDIYSDGEKRFAAKIPPGFRDMDKAKGAEAVYSFGGIVYQAKYGDLLLWLQLIERAKDEKTKSVILLTDDDKDDWWWNIESSGKKKLGPRPELIEEIRRKAEIDNFYIYSSEQFLNLSRTYLAAEVSEESIAQVREVAHSIQSNPTDWRLESASIESAVFHWVLERAPTSEIVSATNQFPDIVVNTEEGHKIGYEVLTARSYTVAMSRLQKVVSRAFHNIGDFSFSKIYVVIVLQDTNKLAPLLKRIENLQIDRLKDIGIFVGHVVHDPDARNGRRFIVLAQIN